MLVFILMTVILTQEQMKFISKEEKKKITVLSKSQILSIMILPLQITRNHSSYNSFEKKKEKKKPHIWCCFKQ